MSARFKEVDIAKGIGIVLVVLGHAFQGVVSKSGLAITGSYSRIYTSIFKSSATMITNS